MVLPSTAWISSGWANLEVLRAGLLTKREYIRLASEPESVNAGAHSDALDVSKEVAGGQYCK